MNTNTSTTKKVISAVVLLLMIVIAIFLSMRKEEDKDKEEVVQKNNDYKNTSYNIDGDIVILKDGYAETEVAPGSASKIITKYFGNEIKKDLNNDGREDIAFLITQEGAGSGTFFYVVGALNNENGFIGSQALLIGDRISPQSTESGPGNSIIVNYLGRGHGEPMSTKPSVAKSMRLILDPQSMQFGEVVQNFEGEADPSVMTLSMNTWKWIDTKFSDGKVMTPKKDVFTITFNNDDTFSATTDCNGVGGKYTATKSTILFSDTVSTLMFCDGSQEPDFQNILAKTESYIFTSKGELVLNLKNNEGKAYFR